MAEHYQDPSASGPRSRGRTYLVSARRSARLGSRRELHRVGVAVQEEYGEVDADGRVAGARAVESQAQRPSRSLAIKHILRRCLLPHIPARGGVARPWQREAA